MKIYTTIAEVRDLGPCADRYAVFLAAHGRVQGDIDLLEILHSNGREDLAWLAQKLPQAAQAWAEYKRVEASAWAEYERVEASAWAEYVRDRDQALADERVEAQARAEYKRIKAQALAEYERVTALAESYH